jgi:hypothetical protein
MGLIFAQSPEETNQVFDRLTPSEIFGLDLNVELLFELHDEFDEVERVGFGQRQILKAGGKNIADLMQPLSINPGK